MSEASHDPPPPGGEPRTFRFKPREFTAVNPPASTPSLTPTRVRDHLAAANARPPPTATSGPVRAPDDEIHAVLRDNVARANAAGLNEAKPLPRRRSRRLRDCLLVTMLTNLFIGAVAIVSPGAQLFCLAGAVFFDAAFAWVIWAVMDDY